ncbi:MAG: VOC family protein [Balneolaceae bacterium]
MSAMNLNGIIKGLHHVTATVNEAQEDYDFYTKTLGLRLVKETVNFDNEKVYHFYYGNEIGSPSTIFTTFPYKDQGVREGVIGHGQVYQTSFSIPEGTLQFWKNRLIEKGITVKETDRFGTPILEFQDPSGLRLDIMEADTDNRVPVWSTHDVPKEVAIRGIHNVTILIPNKEETSSFLLKFGYQITNEGDGLTLFEAGEGGAGNSLIMKIDPKLPAGINGLGTVHHVAHRIGRIEESIQLKEYLETELGLKVTEVRDRKYFKSIYFRIPGNVLFEVATEDPGFLVDESNEDLGTSLKLPDWQEPNRQRIEKGLEPYQK